MTASQVTGNVRFIGDLSRADVEVLAHCAEKATGIVEFGSGGSTQIFAQIASHDARIVSVDTNDAWIERTRDNLKRLGIVRAVDFMPHSDWTTSWESIGYFDLAFDDGARDKRLSFALQSWQGLTVGGKLLMHDTRRARDLRNVVRVIAAYPAEVESASFNYRGSNITVLTKRRPLAYENWNVVEGKAPWEYGAAPPPENAF